MATRRYHKKHVTKQSRKRKMHGGKLLSITNKTPVVLLGTEIDNVLVKINGTKRTKDDIEVYKMTTGNEVNNLQVTWEFNESGLANIGKGAAYLGSLFGATRSVLEATKDNITRIYNGKVNLTQIKELPKHIFLSPSKVEFLYKETEKDIEFNVNPVMNDSEFKTAIFYFYLYLQD